MRVKISLNLTDEQVAALKKYAAETYSPSLGITWRTVAAGWAILGIEDRIERQAGHAEEKTTA
jgi:hypothetical protein